jgi:hypothetical protein
MLEKISAVLSQAVSAVLAVSGSFSRFASEVETLLTPILLLVTSRITRAKLRG